MRGRSMRGRVALLAACGLVCAGGAGSAGAQADAGDLDGFTPGHAAMQRAYEARFQQGVSAQDIGRLSRGLSRRPHRVGTENQQAVIRASLAKLRSYGLDARMHSYDVYLSRPEQIQVSMTKPGPPRQLSVKEKPFPWLQDFGDVVDGYNAYSPPGDVTSQLVYVNYGLPEDYAALDDLGVSVAGKIAIVRYGNSFRGVKVHLAEEHGAKGVIIYSDPEDDGYVKGPVYPFGPWRPADSIQRGSIQFLWEYPGDPLTPGESVGARHPAARTGSGHGSREDPEHADLLRRGAAVAEGAPRGRRRPRRSRAVCRSATTSGRARRRRT